MKATDSGINVALPTSSYRIETILVLFRATFVVAVTTVDAVLSCLACLYTHLWSLAFHPSGIRNRVQETRQQPTSSSLLFFPLAASRRLHERFPSQRLPVASKAEHLTAWLPGCLTVLPASERAVAASPTSAVLGDLVSLLRWIGVFCLDRATLRRAWRPEGLVDPVLANSEPGTSRAATHRAQQRQRSPRSSSCARRSASLAETWAHFELCSTDPVAARGGAFYASRSSSSSRAPGGSFCELLLPPSSCRSYVYEVSPLQVIWRYACSAPWRELENESSPGHEAWWVPRRRRAAKPQRLSQEPLRADLRNWRRDDVRAGAACWGWELSNGDP